MTSVLPILVNLLLSIPLTLAGALVLVWTNAPRLPPGLSGGLNFSRLLARSATKVTEPVSVPMRDHTLLPVRLYGTGNHIDRIVILLHGSGWHGLQWNHMARGLESVPGTYVVVPDLRGHGSHPARRGDVDYIGQLEDDIADLIGHFRPRFPAAEVLLVGHSSGGGLAVRFSGGRHGHLVDRYVLIAPFLGHNAPTTRKASGGWAYPAVRRIIGLTILNAFRIRAFNALPVICFAMPQQVLDGPLGHTATTAYSYRLNVSYAPRHYARDLSAMDQPSLLIVGAEDEAFDAEAYGKIAAAQRDCQFVSLPGAGHLDYVDDDRTVAAIIRWMLGREVPIGERIDGSSP